MEEIGRESLTEREFKKMMNSINKDLEFTTETERDFKNKRLPTLSLKYGVLRTGYHTHI